MLGKLETKTGKKESKQESKARIYERKESKQ